MKKCPECDQPMLPKGKKKLPNEYDHAQGCPLAPEPPPTEPPTLNELLEKARHHVITPEEAEAQRQSWVRGEMALSEAERGMTTVFPAGSRPSAPAPSGEPLCKCGHHKAYICHAKNPEVALASNCCCGEYEPAESSPVDLKDAAPDLLSLADSLAEAARRVTRQSCATAEEYNQRLDLKVALGAWDAARKGR